MTTKKLKRAILDARPSAKAALTCLDCGESVDFEGRPNLRETMIQIDQFKQAHLACKETTR